MNLKLFFNLFCILISSILYGQDIEPILTGYSDLLKVADYDYTTDEWVNYSGYACNRLRDGKPEEAIEFFEEHSFDFIHNYPMVACDDDPNNGVMLNHYWSNNPNYDKFFILINYIVMRDREENGVSGWDSPYCREIFNLKNPRGETLLDQIADSRQSFIKYGYSTKAVDDVIELITKLGAKTGAELDGEPEN